MCVVGLQVWDGSVVLAKYLEHQWDSLGFNSRPPNVLELGSGMGLCSLATAALGAKSVLATDLPYCLKELDRNIQWNLSQWREPNMKLDNMISEKPSISTAPLDWFNPTASPIRMAEVDLVIGADIVWLDKLIVPLVNTIQTIFQCQLRRFEKSRDLTNGSENKNDRRNGFCMLLQHTCRSRLVDQQLMEQLLFRGFTVDQKTLDDPLYGTTEDIQIFQISKAFEHCLAKTDV